MLNDFNSVVYLSNYFLHGSILKYLLLWEESTPDEMVLVPNSALYILLSQIFIFRKIFHMFNKNNFPLKTIKVEALVFYPLSTTKIIDHSVLKYSKCETNLRLTILSHCHI